ncbi:hypothetical protein ABT404_00660 [Streptomyces hyaluromycini]|uniref:Major facilitator superfamily (MFS) profile domain-containing protein n=1 Tax=Streptomyces hyaluromycini TaxID=1377993 RepID=A0ABV1WMF9_9ACTN
MNGLSTPGGLGLCAGASLAATFTSEPGILIALRTVLGVAAAFVMPATPSTITSTFPRAQQARVGGRGRHRRGRPRSHKPTGRNSHDGIRREGPHRDPSPSPRT